MPRSVDDSVLGDVITRLNFSSPSSSPTGHPPSRPPRSKQPALPTIPEEDPEKRTAGAKRPPPEPCPSPPSRPSSPAEGQRQVTSRPPGSRSMVQTSPAPSVSPRKQQHAAAAAVALREIERKRAAEASMELERKRAAEASRELERKRAAEASRELEQRRSAEALREIERRRAAADAAAWQLQLQAWVSGASWLHAQHQRLYTVEGAPAGYETKWEELHPESQGLLLQIEDKMREYRHESDLLDQCSRLYDLSVSNRSFELDASQVSQEIGSTSIIMDREMASIQSLMAIVKEMMWNTDSAIRSYVKLRPWFIHRYSGIADAGSVNNSESSGAPTDFNQCSTMAPTFHFYRVAARRPSPFMQHTVAKFENHLEECRRMAGQLEHLIRINNDKNYSNSLESLSKVVSNVYDYLIHVASKVENLHQYAEIMRNQYLNDRRRMSDWSDPFLEADRREVAKQEVAARIVHPSGFYVSMMESQPRQSSFPTVATSSSTCSAALRTPPSLLPWSNIRTSPSPLPSSFSSSRLMRRPTPTVGSTPARFASSTSFSSLGGPSLFRTPSGGIHNILYVIG
ncbi:hypothetical protein ABZP36_005635 [Zizania latifolia]